MITSNAPSISRTEFVVDELDRMYRRMVQNIRAGFPDLLTRPFEVSQIYQHIIPYRLNRREMAIESNEAYELTLMQLLSGARALVTGDDEMQRALRAELESPNPDLTAFRAFATSLVALDPKRSVRSTRNPRCAHRLPYRPLPDRRNPRRRSRPRSRPGRPRK